MGLWMGLGLRLGLGSEPFGLDATSVKCKSPWSKDQTQVRGWGLGLGSEPLGLNATSVKCKTPCPKDQTQARG